MAPRLPSGSRVLWGASMRCQSGFAYLTALFLVAVMTTGLALLGQVWETNARREKEAELLHIGQEYRKAIERYYLAGPRQYPRQLDDLLKDPRKAGTERYLRRKYEDPVTRNNNWGIVKGPDGGVMGVHSLSELEPLKQSNFRLRDAAFEGARTYADWKFLFTPPGAVAPKPAANPPAVR